jgi:integrase
MNAPIHPVQSAADVLQMLQQADLPPLRKRDMVSAVRRICDMLGCAPASLRLDVPGLRIRVVAVRPAAHGISPKTFSNIRSLFAAALEWAGVVEGVGRGVARRHPAWAPLVLEIAGDKRLSMGLAAFTNWCAAKGIDPAGVDDAVVRRFAAWLEGRTLHVRPRDIVRGTPRCWNEARDRVPGWPQTTLTPISFRPASANLRWDELPAALRAEAEVYLALRAGPDLFDIDPNTPTRPLAASTIRQQREHIRLAASVLAREGVSVAGLADLVEAERFKTVLRHYHNKADGRANAFAILMAKTLIDVARYQVRVTDAHLAELKKLATRLPAVPFDLTAKNKALFSQLESEQMRARLLHMPDDLMRRVKAELQAGKLRFVDAQVAVAVEILLSAPLRPQNLSVLNWTRHVREPNGPRGKLLLYIPAAETKTKRRDLIFELPPELAKNIRFYAREILPRLGADPNGDLFVVAGGRRKDQETLSEQITERIARQVGLHMTPHQFRHVAALLYLDAHPDGFQSVSDLLGHAWSKTTQVYAGSSSRRASRAYGAHVIEQRRALALKRRPRRR